MPLRYRTVISALVGAGSTAIIAVVAFARSDDPSVSLGYFVANGALLGAIAGAFLTILAPWRTTGILGYFGAWITACAVAAVPLAAGGYWVTGDPWSFGVILMGGLGGFGVGAWWKIVVAGVD